MDNSIFGVANGGSNGQTTRGRLSTENGELGGAGDVDGLGSGGLASNRAGLAVTTTLVAGNRASLASLGTVVVVVRGRGKSGLKVQEDLLLLGLGLEGLGLGGGEEGLLVLLVEGISGLPLGVVGTFVGLADLLLGVGLGGLDLEVLEVLLKGDGGVGLLDGGSGGLLSSGSRLSGVVLGNLLASGLVLELLLLVPPALVDSLFSVDLAGLGVSVGTGVLLTLVVRGLGALGTRGRGAGVAVLGAIGLLVVLAGSRAGSAGDGGSGGRLGLGHSLLYDGSGLTIIA